MDFAERFVTAYGDDPLRLHRLGLQIANRPGLDSEEYDRAARHVERAVELAPDVWSFWCTLGKVRFRQGAYAEALECFDHTRELKAGDHGPETWAWQAMCMDRLSQSLQARDLLDRARAANPRNPQVRRALEEAERALSGR